MKLFSSDSCSLTFFSSGIEQGCPNPSLRPEAYLNNSLGTQKVMQCILEYPSKRWPNTFFCQLQKRWVVPLPTQVQKQPKIINDCDHTQEEISSSPPQLRHGRGKTPRGVRRRKAAERKRRRKEELFRPEDLTEFTQKWPFIYRGRGRLGLWVPSLQGNLIL